MTQRLEEYEKLVNQMAVLLEGKDPNPHPFYFVRKASDAIPALIDMVRERDASLYIIKARSAALADTALDLEARAVAAEARVWDLENAARLGLNFIENSEGELGIELSSGNALRAALGRET